MLKCVFLAKRQMRKGVKNYKYLFILNHKLFKLININMWKLNVCFPKKPTIRPNELTIGFIPVTMVKNQALV